MFYDITQEVFSGAVYPGDSAPAYRRAQDIARGDLCTVTDFSMCAHNGTHADAPAHFLAGGATVECLPPEVFVGRCAVLSAEQAMRAPSLPPRVLCRGGALTPKQARALAARVRLVGVEAQSVGDAQVHALLLGAGVAVLEGLVLTDVPDGEYELIALPLKLGGADGAPVRAVLRTL